MSDLGNIKFLKGSASKKAKCDLANKGMIFGLEKTEKYRW